MSNIFFVIYTIFNIDFSPRIYLSFFYIYKPNQSISYEINCRRIQRQ